MPAPDEILAREPWRSKLLDIAGLAPRRLRWRHGDLKDESREVTDALLAAFLATVRSIGARPVVVHLPANEDVASDAPRHARTRSRCCAARRTSRFCRCASFHRSIPDNPLGRASHWNASTHDVAADEIAEFVRREHLREPRERSREGAPSR